MNSRFKIVSDGSINGTRVVDLETGEVLPNVESVTWDAGVGQVPRATITLIGLPVELEVSADPSLKPKSKSGRTYISAYCNGKMTVIESGYYSGFELRYLFRVKDDENLLIKTESDMTIVEDDTHLSLLVDGHKFITSKIS